ncbi:MAG TPA: efflux RND transporter permease subunit, partial [Opitutus sp.]|nr:efflux RND transporter permease subunit [Opitutus sp.]
ADNYVEKLDHGLPQWDAAWRAASDLAVPVFTATLAIVLAFAPLGFFLTGSVGEFIVALPITVAIALTVSFLVAMFLTPVLCYTFIRQGLKEQPRNLSARVLAAVQSRYTRLLHPLVRHPILTLIAGVLSLPAALLLLPLIQQKFFPAAERAQFVIEVDLPLGTRLEATDRVVRRIEETLRGDPRIATYAAFVGTAAPRVYYSFAPEFPRPSYGMLLVSTHSVAAADAAVRDYAAKLRDLAPGARINVASFQQGIPVEAPVEVRIVGPDLAVLRTLGDQVRAIFRRAPGATQVRDDFLEGFSLDLRVNSEVANRLGLTTSVIASQVMTGFEGYAATELWEHDAPVPIVLRLSEAHRSAFDDLDRFMLRAPLTQGSVPLQQVAAVEPVWSPAQIAHRGGVRTLTVRAQTATNVLPSQVLGAIRRELPQLELPPGYRVEIGGEHEGQQETFGKMAGALLASVVFIYLVLLFQFRSSRETLLVMLAIPLTVFGAMAGLVITRNPLGFTAAVGLISLVGIVIRNAIILVDHADELRRAEPIDAPTAAIRAGERRMRPIFLTSMAAAAGVLPMILSRSPLWAPLASVFSVGILWSMAMALLVVPAAYGLTMKQPPPNAKLVPPGGAA